MTKAENEKRQQASDVRRLMQRIHTMAALLIAASVLVGGFNMDRALTNNAADAEIINIAGAQRMLSQRIAALSLLVQDSRGKEQERYLKALDDAHSRMLNGHLFLTAGPNGQSTPAWTNSALKAHYSPDGRDLDGRVTRFLTRTQQLIKAPQNLSGSFAVADFTDLDALLADLDLAVSLYETNAKRKIKTAEALLKQSTLVALITLFFVAIFVFRPIAKTASGALKQSESELEERSELLSRSFNIAGMGYWLNRVDRPTELWISDELAALYRIEPVARWLTLEEVKNLAQDQNNDVISLAARTCRDTGEPQYVETCIKTGDGTLVDICTSIAAKRDDTGAVESITGVVRDITKEIEARNTIHATVERLRQRTSDLREAQELGNIALWRMPLGEREMELNEDAYQLMRYNFDDSDRYRSKIGDNSSKGTHLRALCLGDSFERIVETSREVFQTGKSAQVAILARRGDGTVADLNVRIKLQRSPEGKPTALFGTMQDITEAKEAERQLEQLAYYDHLTGLSNRTLFMRRLEAICKDARQSGSSYALVLIDLDDFKEINDGLGHQAGDDFLCEIGRRLSQLAGPRNLVARLGGDEFAILISNQETKEDVRRLVAAMLSSMAVPFRVGAAEAMGGGSAGICMLPTHTAEASEALRFADLALYDAKESGRNRLSFFDEAMSEKLQSRLSLSRDLRTAIAGGELETHFQPIVSGQSGEVLGFETLMRWQHKEKGWISPTEFIPIAESSHLIGDIGAFALKDACRIAKTMNETSSTPIEVAVNVSAAQLWHGDLEQMVAGAIETSALAPGLLCIELTESVFVGDSMERVDALLRRLKMRGVQLALDDFGTGYSSLGYLNNLPFDKLKIDRSFVAGADVSKKRFQVLEGIVSLARGLGMKVVAEGVETASELRAVTDLRCDAIQGFYFGKPSPEAQALQVIQDINAKAHTRNLQARAAGDIAGITLPAKSA